MSSKKVIGGSLGAIVILVLTQILVQLVASLLVLIKVPEVVRNILAGVIYVGLILFLLMLFAKKLLKIEMADLGITKFSIRTKWIIIAILLPVLVKAVYLLLFPGEYVFSGMKSSQIFSTLISGITFTGIAAGFIEEMVFRGIILNLIKLKWNVKVAVLVPSALFGLAHIIGMNFSVTSCLTVLISGTMVGIMFSLIEIESGSVWNSGIVHAVWNIMVGGGGLAIKQEMDEYSVMTYVLKSKLFVLTGGEFGIDASIVSFLGYVVVALIAIYMIKKEGVTAVE